MAKKDRIGGRKGRDGARKRIPDLGYYYIVTDTKKTEADYLSGIRKRLPVGLRDRLVICVSKAKTSNLVSSCLAGVSIEPQYREPWIVLDRDKVPDFDGIIDEAECNGISVGWSNPCIEIWFAAYLEDMRMLETSVQCCDYFSSLFKRKTGIEYDKADERIYGHLLHYGDEKAAIRIAEERLRHYLRQGGHIKPSQMLSCTTLHRLVMEINAKISGAD